LAGLGHGIVHALAELLLNLSQLGSHALADRRAPHRKPPFPFFPLMCVKPRKSNVSGLPSPLRFRFCSANRPNSIRRVLSGWSSSPNFPSRSRKVLQKAICVRLMLESYDGVVRVADDHHLALRPFLAPDVHPEIESVVQVDIREAAVKSPNLAEYLSSFPTIAFLHHPSVQPFLDQPQDAGVGDAMLHELDQPTFVEVIEKSSNVGVKNVVHLLLQERIRQRIQRLMLAAPRAKPIRKAEKVFLVNLVEDGDHGLLDNLSSSAATPSGRCRPSLSLCTLFSMAALDMLRDEPGCADRSIDLPVRSHTPAT
jgi:hypothetical protein